MSSFLFYNYGLSRILRPCNLSWIETINNIPIIPCTMLVSLILLLVIVYHSWIGNSPLENSNVHLCNNPNNQPPSHSTTLHQWRWLNPRNVFLARIGHCKKLSTAIQMCCDIFVMFRRWVSGPLTSITPFFTPFSAKKNRARIIDMLTVISSDRTSQIDFHDFVGQYIYLISLPTRLKGRNDAFGGPAASG